MAPTHRKHDSRDLEAGDRSLPARLPTAWIYRGVATLALLLLLRATESLMVPLATACVLTLLFAPAAERLQRRGVPAVVTAAVLAFLPPIALGIAGVLAAPTAVDGAHQAAASLRRIGGFLEPVVAQGGARGDAAGWLAARLVWDDRSLAGWIGANAGGMALTLVSSLILLFFLLLGQRPLVAGLMRAMPDPPARRWLRGALDDGGRGIAAFVGVMGAMNLALALATGLALAALGLPQPVFWAALTFVLVFVPYLGPAAVTLLLLVAGFDAFGGRPVLAAPAAAFLLLHAVEANFLSPWWMGQRLQLGRPALLVAVLIGGWTWGLAGGLLAVPVLIVLAAALRHAPRRSAGHAVLNALLAAEGSVADRPLPLADAVPLRPVVTVRSADTRADREHRVPVVPAKPRSMRIAYVTETYPPEINGVALTVARTVAYLRAVGHQVDLIRPRQAGEPGGGSDADDEWRSSGYPIPVYPAMRFGLARPSTLAARFAATGIELVHVATEGPLGWAAIRAANRLGLAVTSDFRTNFHQYSRYYHLGWLEPLIGGYLRRFHNRTQRSFAPTRQTCNELRAAGFERVELAGRGVDLDRFDPARRDPALRAQWLDGAPDGPVLLHVGRLAAEKNVELALRSFGAVRRREPTARMVVVGEGPLQRRLEREHPDALFVGTQTGAALAAIYASADLFLFPSLSDTFGNVTLEALASGLPVVAFDVAAASDHVVDGVNGRTVAPGDATAFVAATAELALRHRTLAPMREAARRTAAGLDWPSVLARFQHQLRDTLEDHDVVRTLGGGRPANAKGRSADESGWLPEGRTPECADEPAGPLSKANPELQSTKAVR